MDNDNSEILLLKKEVADIKEDIKEIRVEIKDSKDNDVEIRIAINDLINSNKELSKTISETNKRVDKICDRLDKEDEEKIKDNKKFWQSIGEKILWIVISFTLAYIGLK